MEYNSPLNVAASQTRYTDEPNTPVKPITLHITDQQQSTLAVAVETRARLWQLRDRLFGPAPPSTGAATGSDPRAPNCFADAAREGGHQLALVINDIDSLTAELSQRL